MLKKKLSGTRKQSEECSFFKSKKHEGVNAISRFKLSIHKTNGYMYASTQEPIYDKKTSSVKYTHIHWGTLTKDYRFYPNERFLFTKPEIRNQLIYPIEWKLDEVYKLVRNFSYATPVIIREKELSKKKEKIKC